MAFYMSASPAIFRAAPLSIAKAVDGFTKNYGLKRLVYAEFHEDIRGAIQREKNLKHWSRAWKVQLIHRDNPTWEDLYDRLA